MKTISTSLHLRRHHLGAPVEGLVHQETLLPPHLETHGQIRATTMTQVMMTNSTNASADYAASQEIRLMSPESTRNPNLLELHLWLKDHKGKERCLHSLMSLANPTTREQLHLRSLSILLRHLRNRQYPIHTMGIPLQMKIWQLAHAILLPGRAFQTHGISHLEDSAHSQIAVVQSRNSERTMAHHKTTTVSHPQTLDNVQNKRFHSQDRIRRTSPTEGGDPT